MEKITLTFDIPQSKEINGDQISELRKDMALRLDEDLREAGVGKWCGGLQSLGKIQIFLMIDGCREALPVIKETLNDHWLFPSMKIRRLK